MTVSLIDVDTHDDEVCAPRIGEKGSEAGK